MPNNLKFQHKSFERPDETRPFRSHGHLDVITFDDKTTIGRAVFEPGWKWSNDVAPIAGTTSCQFVHVGHCLSGQMTIRMDSGEEFTLRAGDAFEIPPGHDAWVVGDEPCVLFDVAAGTGYAKEKEKVKAA